MLSKKNRADTMAVERIFKGGKIFQFPVLTFRFVITDINSTPRISVIVPKTVAKLAVKRNTLRRRGYVALAEFINKFPVGLVGVLIFKKNEEDILIIHDEIEKILNKIN